MTRKEANELLEESLVYERAFSRTSRIVNAITNEMNLEIVKAKQAGEDLDRSYHLVVDALNRLKDEYRKKSDELWHLVDKGCEKDNSGFERLANAVMKNVAESYETALCGNRCLSEIKRIEDFAKNGAEVYTQLDFSKVLERIRKVQPKFVSYAERHGPEIHECTMKNRDKDYVDNDRDNPHRCPLCGGGMFTFGSIENGTAIVKCTGCSLFARVRVVRNAS